MFRGVLLHTLGQDFPAPALPVTSTAPLPRMALESPAGSPKIGAAPPPYESLKQAAERGDINAAQMLGEDLIRGSAVQMDAALTDQRHLYQ